MLLKDYIAESGVTVVSLAKRLGVTRDCIHKYISGDRRPKNKLILNRILKATDGKVTANDFYLNGHSKKKGKRT